MRILIFILMFKGFKKYNRNNLESFKQALSRSFTFFVGSSVLSIASKRALTLPPCQAPCKGSQDSLGFWITCRGFRIRGTWFQSLSVELGFWIPILSRIPDSLRCIPDSLTWSDLSFDKYWLITLLRDINTCRSTKSRGLIHYHRRCLPK